MAAARALGLLALPALAAAQSSSAPTSVGDVSIRVVQLASSLSGYETYQVSVAFDRMVAADVYALFGRAGSRLVIPPAYQAPAPFGSDVGPPNPAFFSMAPDCEYDSFLTIGMDGPARTPGALSTIGIDFGAWDESNGILTDDGAVFFLDPDHGATTEPVTFLQLTVPAGTSFYGNIGAQGRSTSGQDDWSKSRMAFSSRNAVVCQDASMRGCEPDSGPPPPPDRPPPPPPPPPPSGGGGQAVCNTDADMQSFFGPINEQCCHGAGDDCSSGAPATCSSACSSVLLPFRSNCATVLGQDQWSAIKASIDGAAATCNGGSQAEGPCAGNPCQNGGVCTPGRPPKPPRGGGHRRLQSRYWCACRPGFRGANCGDGAAVPSASPLIIKGVFDISLPSSGGRAVQLVAVRDVLDLGAFALGVANNGGGSDGVELSLPAVPLLTGQSFWAIRDIEAFSTYMQMDFGTEGLNWMTNNHLSCNGDDAIELFAITGAEDDPTITVVDVFGDVDVDGTGEPWEYKDAWARRRDSVEAAAAAFNLDEWEVAPKDCTDHTEQNAQSSCPYSCGRDGRCPGYGAATAAGSSPCVPMEGSVSVTGREDDAEEVVGEGTMNVGSSDLELTHDGGEQLIAVRFPSVAIPPAAQIDNAVVIFDIDEVRPGQSDAPTTIAVYAESSANSAPITDADSDLSSREVTKAAVRWNPEPSTETHELLTTPDLSVIVNEVVRRPGWAEGNALTILFGHIDGAGIRWVEAARDNDGAGGKTPMLQWSGCSAGSGGGSGGGAGGPMQLTDAVFSVRSRDDDAEESVETGEISLGSSDLELMSDGGEQVVLIVFPAVTVPARATITHAQVLFDVDEVRPGQSDAETTITISGQIGPAALPQEQAHDITSRRTTRTSVIWRPEPSANTHDDLTTPDIGAVINEIVNGPGWSAGSNLGVVFGHVSGEGVRWVESSRENNGIGTPALRVSYASTASSAPSASPLMIKGVLDLDLPQGGNSGKAVQLVATADIADLSAFGVGVGNNGGGTDGVEVILPPVPLRAGQTFWCLRDADAFQDFTGIDVGDEGVNWIEDNGLSQNGDDAVELFFGSNVVDIFGDVHTDGSGEPWEYKDAWARRRDSVRAASARFDLGEWEVAETNCSDDAESNESSECPYACGPGRLPGRCPGYGQ